MLVVNKETRTYLVRGPRTIETLEVVNFRRRETRQTQTIKGAVVDAATLRVVEDETLIGGCSSGGGDADSFKANA